MRIKIIYSDKAIKDLRKIGEQDTQRILKKIEYYIKQDDPFQYAKKLKAPFGESYRFRVGEYRVIFDVDKKGNFTLLVVIKITHRKDGYL